MDKETTTSVTIDRKTFARLDRLAKSNNVSKKEFLYLQQRKIKRF